MHLSDFTINEYSINTETQRDFNKILKIINFKGQQSSVKDLPYITEIIGALGIDKVLIDLKSEFGEVSIDNILSRLKKLNEDIAFFISHFHEIGEKFLRKIKEGGCEIE